MENRLQIKVPFEELSREIDNKIKLAENLEQKEVKTEEELNDFRKQFESWNSETLIILKDAFNNPRNEFVNDFQQIQPNSYAVPGMKKTLKQIIDDEKLSVKLKIRSLYGTIKILQVCDAIIEPEKIDFSKRANYTIEEKLDLILDKYYDLYDDLHYPLLEILTGNGVIPKRHGECRELAGLLENDGLVTTMGYVGDNIGVKLTAEGARQVEEARKIYKEDNSDMTDKEVILKTLDFIKHKSGHIPIKDFWAELELENERQARIKIKLEENNLAEHHVHNAWSFMITTPGLGIKPDDLDDKGNLKKKNKHKSLSDITNGIEGINIYVDLSRIEELKKIQSKKFDFTRLIKQCQELNDASAKGNYYSVILLVRAIIDHVPPIFEKKNFKEVANNYGPKSFKDSMDRLETSSRKIADSSIHQQIRKRETLPNKTQVNFSNDLDVLLEEITRKLP